MSSQAAEFINAAHREKHEIVEKAREAAEEAAEKFASLAMDNYSWQQFRRGCSQDAAIREAEEEMRRWVEGIAERAVELMRDSYLDQS